MSNISTQLVPQLIPADLKGYTKDQLKRNFESINRLSVDFTAKQIRHIGTTAIAVGTGVATAETRLQSVKFSAGLMGKNGIIQFSAFGSTSGILGARIVRVIFDRGGALPGHIIATLTANAGTDIVFWNAVGYVANQNDFSLQISTGAIFTGVTGIPALTNMTQGAWVENTELNTAVNTTAEAFSISTTGETINAADEITSSFLSVLFIPGLS